MAVHLAVLSAGAIRRSVAKIARLFEHHSGGSVSLDFAPAPEVRARVLAGKEVDVIIASAGVLTALAKESKIEPTTRLIFGQARLAVMMRNGADTPDLSSMAMFRQALLNADMLSYNEGSSGEQAAEIIDKLELRSPMGSKIHVAQRGADYAVTLAML